MRPRNGVQWSRYGPGILPAWVAEMDYATAAPVRDALIAAVLGGRLGYPDDHERHALACACADWLQRVHGWSVAPKQVHIVPDVLTGLQVAIDTCSPAASPVVLPTPAYPPLFDVVEEGRRPVVEVPMVTDGERASLDLDGIKRAFAAGARTLMLCNPHNPLGRVFTLDELTALAALVQEHGARVVSDDVHASLVYPGHCHIPYASLPGADGHTITVLSASKGWNLAGLSCAQVVTTNDADRRAWQRLPKLRTWGASILGIVAATAAFTAGDQWRAEVLASLAANSRLLHDALATELPEVGFRPPEGTYLAWLDFRALDLPTEPADYLLAAAGVALSAGRAFGRPGAGHARLTFATSPDVLITIVDAIARAVRTVHQTPQRTGSGRR